MITIKKIDNGIDAKFEVTSPWFTRKYFLPCSYFAQDRFPEDCEVPTRDELVENLFEILEAKHEEIHKLEHAMKVAEQHHIKRAFYITNPHEKMKSLEAK